MKETGRGQEDEEVNKKTERGQKNKDGDEINKRRAGG